MRRFGIEIECAGDRTALSAALGAAGFGGRFHGYQGNDEHQWVVKSDASIQSVTGAEVVSPPLDFDDPEQREQVSKVVRTIREAGARTTPEAGIHIHIESRDLTAKQVAAVGRLFVKYEDLLYRLASSGWNSVRPRAFSNYARLYPDELKERLPRVRDEDSLRLCYYGRGRGTFAGHSDMTRSYGVNLHSHFWRGTIEFRIFNSSMNPERIQTYIAICMALVQDARNGKIRSINKRMALGDMAAGRLDPDKAIFAFLSVVRYQAGMSVEDYRRVKKLWKDSVPQQAYY